jgi:PAS domain S-box-containing protein
LTDAAGQIVKWYGMNTDIDDRKRAEVALRAHERRFRLIVDGLPAQASLRAPEDNLEFVNRQFLEYSGATLDQLQSRSWHDTWHPDDRARARAAWTEALATGHPCDVVGRRRRADGVHRWFHMRGQLVLLQSRPDRFARHASRTRGRTEPSGELRCLHQRPTHTH